MNTVEYPLRLTKDTRRTAHLDKFLGRKTDFPGFEVVQELIGYGDYEVTDELREAVAAMAHELEFVREREQVTQILEAPAGRSLQIGKDALTKR